MADIEKPINTILGFEKHRMPQIPKEDLKAGLQALQAPDSFGVLGVTEEDTADEIKTHFRTLVKKLHPDIVGERTGDFPDVFNIMTQKVTEAYEQLKDHVPPPKTLLEAAYQLSTPVDFEQMLPSLQLNTLVARLFLYGLEDTNSKVILRMLNEIKDNLFPINRAYAGEVGFKPLDGKPLPDINEVLEVLKKARIMKEWRKKKEYDPKFDMFFETREWEYYYCVESIFVPHGRRKIHSWLPDASGLHWISKFHEFNKIPSLLEGERLNRAEKQKQARTRKHGRFVGALLNLISQPSGMISEDEVDSSEGFTTEEVKVVPKEDEKPATIFLASKN